MTLPSLCEEWPISKETVSNSEMRYFFGEQGRTRVFAESYDEYVAEENPRRTPLIGKRTISESETSYISSSCVQKYSMVFCAQVLQ